MRTERHPFLSFCLFTIKAVIVIMSASAITHTSIIDEIWEEKIDNCAIDDCIIAHPFINFDNPKMLFFYCSTETAIFISSSTGHSPFIRKPYPFISQTIELSIPASWDSNI